MRSVVPRREATGSEISLISPEKIGIVFGALDSAVALTFALNVNLQVYYFVSLCVKLAILVLFLGKYPVPASRNIVLVSLIGLCLVVGFLSRPLQLDVVLAALGFSAHLLTTGAALSKKSFRFYVQAVSMTGLFVITLYILEWLRGDVQFVFGRATFFNGSAPNLGGEILAAYVFCSGLALSPKQFLAYSCLALIAINPMQSRAAELLILTLQVLVIYNLLFTRRALYLRIAFLLVIGAAILLLWRYAADLGSSTFLLDDADRGLGTGYVGRDSLWSAAWQAFLDHPIFGTGFGYYESIQSFGAHNLFLFALSEMGIFGLVFIAWMGAGILRFGLRRLMATAWMSSILLLAVFNDRFVNLNPYPFLVFVVLWVGKDMISVKAVGDSPIISDGTRAPGPGRNRHLSNRAQLGNGYW